VKGFRLSFLRLLPGARRIPQVARVGCPPHPPEPGYFFLGGVWAKCGAICPLQLPISRSLSNTKRWTIPTSDRMTAGDIAG